MRVSLVLFGLAMMVAPSVHAQYYREAMEARHLHKTNLSLNITCTKTSVFRSNTSVYHSGNIFLSTKKENSAVMLNDRFSSSSLIVSLNHQASRFEDGYEYYSLTVNRVFKSSESKDNWIQWANGKKFKLQGTTSATIEVAIHTSEERPLLILDPVTEIWKDGSEHLLTLEYTLKESGLFGSTATYKEECSATVRQL